MVWTEKLWDAALLCARLNADTGGPGKDQKVAKQGVSVEWRARRREFLELASGDLA